MKNIPLLLALAALGTACQPQAASTDTVQKAAAPAVVPVNYRPAPAPTPPASTLSAASLALLRQHNLAPLLQAKEEGDSSLTVQNGFFGTGRFRVEMAFTSVQRDARQPNVFRVQGKSRYKKVITPFSGLITITKLVKQPTYTAQEVAEGSQNQPGMYTAIGSYELREDATQRGAGIFRGKVALDVLFDKDGSTREMMQTMRTLTQGGGLKYDGNWTNNTSGRVQPAVWVHNIFAYQGPQVFSDFTVGERDVDFNPKYAKLGWNTYWQNDEWWADSPKATVSL